MNTVLALFALFTGLGEPRTVTGPVSKLSFNAFGQASGLQVGLNVGENDPRWRDRELALYGDKLYVEGKLVTLPEAIQWLSTAVKVDEKRENVLSVIEVTVKIDPNRYVQIARADFKLVPWEQYYPKTAKRLYPPLPDRRSVPAEITRRVGMVPDKKCPKCDSPDYRFRGRKNEDDGTITKYACAPCGHTWKVKTEQVTLVKAEEGLWEVDGVENLRAAG